jgi:hypothetical protein
LQQVGVSQRCGIDLHQFLDGVPMCFTSTAKRAVAADRRLPGSK